MKQNIAQLPALVDAPGVLVHYASWGGMACTYYEVGAGTDMAPTLKGLPGDACPCPHWGYLLRGAVRVRYTDGRDEVMRAGEMFYLPPGHVPVFEEDTAFVEVSPQAGYDELLRHAGLQAPG
jgi:hypothetical protein